MQDCEHISRTCRRLIDQEMAHLRHCRYQAERRLDACLLRLLDLHARHRCNSWANKSVAKGAKNRPCNRTIPFCHEEDRPVRSITAFLRAPAVMNVHPVDREHIAQQANDNANPDSKEDRRPDSNLRDDCTRPKQVQFSRNSRKTVETVAKQWKIKMNSNLWRRECSQESQPASSQAGG